MSVTMSKRQEAIFNVLNDWTDMPQDLFFRIWPELSVALQVEEPKPEQKKLPRDPMPYQNIQFRSARYASEEAALNHAGDLYEFNPRSWASQNREDYR